MRRPILAALIATAVPLAACSHGDSAFRSPPGAAAKASPDATEVPRPAGGTVRIGVTGPLVTDPSALNDASAAQMLQADLLFDGLTAYDNGSHQVVGAVAERWDVVDDGLRWRFVLRGDATFADGSPITAADVVRSLERVASRGVQSLVGMRLEVVDGWDEFAAKTAAHVRGLAAVDARTVEVRLKTPFAPLAELLASPAFGIVPKSTADGVTAPTPSGAFAVTATTPTELTVTRRNGAKAAADRVVITSYRDASALAAAAKDGLVDVTEGDPSLPGRFSVTSAGAPTSLFYAMNLAAPALGKPELRQAIVKAVDRDALRAKAFGSSADTMRSLIGPGAAGARPDGCGAACGYDPAGATALVAALAGSGPLRTVHVDYFEDATGREKAVADAVVASLGAVGIPAEARSHPLGEYGTFVASGRAELFRFGWTGTYPSPDAYLAPLFAAKASDNVASVDDAQANDLLRAARAQLAPAERTAAYVQAEDRIFTLAAVLPIAQYRAQWAATAKVHDVVVGPSGALDVTLVHADA